MTPSQISNPAPTTELKKLLLTHRGGVIADDGIEFVILRRVPFNLSYWSLIAEAHFYLLLPVLFWLTRGLSVRSTAVLLFSGSLLSPLIVRHLTWLEGLYALPSYESDDQSFGWGGWFLDVNSQRFA